MRVLFVPLFRTITKRSIESVAIGSRVSGDNPRPWDFDGEFGVPDQATWQLAKFSLQKEAGNWVDVEMIRPAGYWQAQGAIPGNYVFMQFPELEASGLAKVKSLNVCPAIAQGEGNVVTARIVTRQVAELVEIEVEGGYTLTGTPLHPIWSIERQDWVELGELEVGEHLWSDAGPVEIVRTCILTTGQSVYNLEVHGHHIYQVGKLGLLVHNARGYQTNFFKKYPGKKGKVVVHHSIEQQVLKLYPGLFSKAELDLLKNLRGILKSRNAKLHLSKIRKEWDKFYSKHPTATRAQILAQRNKIDRLWGSQFSPPRKSG